MAGDIGYGNLKGCSGHSGNKITMTYVRPSLVASVELIPDYSPGVKGFKKSVEVMVGKEKYVVGFEPGVILNLGACPRIAKNL